jgi:hypothetical protein
MVELLSALGLVLVIEGALFAIAPRRAQEALRAAAETPADLLRLVGLAAAVAGVIVIWFARRFLGE